MTTLPASDRTRTNKIADAVAAQFKNCGVRTTTEDGRTLDGVCRAMGARASEGGPGGETRYSFADGSAILATRWGTWDFIHPDCECGWCLQCDSMTCPCAAFGDDEEWDGLVAVCAACKAALPVCNTRALRDGERCQCDDHAEIAGVR